MSGHFSKDWTIDFKLGMWLYFIPFFNFEDCVCQNSVKTFILIWNFAQYTSIYFEFLTYLDSFKKCAPLCILVFVFLVVVLIWFQYKVIISETKTQNNNNINMTKRRAWWIDNHPSNHSSIHHPSTEPNPPTESIQQQKKPVYNMLILCK